MCRHLPPWEFRVFTAGSTRNAPSCDDLRLAPEMACLHVLHEAVVVAIESLSVAHSVPPRCVATYSLASGIVPILHALDGLLSDYREARYDDLRALSTPDFDHDELPF